MNTQKAKANGSVPPETGSIFDDVEALKKATAAKLGKLNASAEAGAEVILQRPLRTWFFMTPADDEMMFSGATWEEPETQELYFVAPEMWDHDQLEGAIRPTLFVPYVTAANEGSSVHGIWAVSTVMGNTYTDSIHAEVLPQSRVTWVRTWTVQSTKKYRCQPAKDDYGQPRWLTKTIFEQLALVFPGKRQIRSPKHEVIRRLEGRRKVEAPGQDADPSQT